MCKPISCIITKDDVLFSSTSHRHEDIICQHNLNDGNNGGNFVRVEVTPKNEKWDIPLTETGFYDKEEETNAALNRRVNQ